MYKLKTLYDKLVAKGTKIEYIIDATDIQNPELDYADEYLDTHGDKLVTEHCMSAKMNTSLIVKFKKEEK